MNVEITVRNSNLTTNIRNEVEARFEKLKKSQLDIITPHVIITKDKQSYLVEGIAGIANGHLNATAEHENLYAAINNMAQKLERQLRRHIDKPNAHKHARSGKAHCRTGEIGQFAAA